MSWGDYAHLASSIELAQAATVKIGGGSAVMISERYALTAAHVVIDEGENVLTSNLIATNLWGETRTIINAYFDTAADFAVIELETPFQNSYSIEIANTAAIDAPLLGLQLIDDLHRAHLGRARYGARRQACQKRCDGVMPI